MSSENEGFELARDPDEVPTPLAIAAADFCRRAGRPSSPESVRLALARLDFAEDEELRALVESEPEATPLGPEALVDLVRGLSAEEASAREESGYYVAMARAPRKPPPPRGQRPSSPAANPAERREAQRQELLGALAEAKGDLGKAAANLGVTEDVLQGRVKRLSLVRKAQAITEQSGRAARAPVVRPKGTKVERTRPSAPVPPPLPKHGAGRPPRGRLVLGTSAHRDPRELERPEAKQELRELLGAFKGNRKQLLRRLNEVFVSTKGKLTPEKLDALLQKHHLAKEAEQMELDNLRFLFTQARGDLSEVATRMKLPPPELRKQLEARGLWADAERIRDRYRRELFGRPLSEQIFTFLKRSRYLRELDAMRPMERHLREELERAWDVARDLPEDLRAERLAKRLNVPADLAGELIHRFRLK